MDIAELTTYLGIPISTVYYWRVHGKGPTAYRFGKHLKSPISDLRAWIAEQWNPPARHGAPIGTFGDITTRAIASGIKHLAKPSHSRRKQCHVVLRVALELAVRHEILPSNPMDHFSRLCREPHLPDALTASEVNVICAAIAG